MKRGGINWSSLDRDLSRALLNRDKPRVPVVRDEVARGPKDRRELARGPADRDGFGRGPRDGVGWGSLDRDRIGRDLLDRDRIGRDLLDRDRIGRDLLDRDKIGRDLLDRGRIGRDLLERDRIGRNPPDRDRIGHDMDRGGIGRFLLDREEMGSGPSFRDGMSRSHPDRDGIKWSPLERENMGRVPMDREVALDRLDGRTLDLTGRGQLTWSSVDRDRMTRSPVGRERSPVGRERSPVGRERSPVGRERSPVGREERAWGRVAGGIMGREGIVPGSMDCGELVRDLLARGKMAGGSMGREDELAQGPGNRDEMLRGPPDRGRIAKDPADPDINNQDVTSGRMDQDETTQSDLEPCDMEQSDMEISDTEQGDMDPSDVNQSEVKDENQGKVNDANQGQANDVTGAETSKENAQKSDKSEDEKKFYCEVCRLSCLSSMSFQSHMRGAKHMKNVRPSEGPAAPGPRKYKVKKPVKTLKDYMDEPVRDPLIGLEHVVEFCLPGKLEPSYHCELCGFKTELAPMIEHLNGFRHRRAYISKEFPFLLKAPPGQKEDKVQFLRRMAADIERDEGLKMYRYDLLSIKKKIKSLLEIKPNEIPIKSSTGDNTISDNETLKTKALQSLETYDIESDAEAVLVMTITQELSDILKAYCRKVKEETVHAEKAAKARSVAETLPHTNPAIEPPPQSFGPSGSGIWNMVPGQQAPHIAGNINWTLKEFQRNHPPPPYLTGGPNWNQGVMQNPPPLGPGNWDQGPIMQNTLPQKGDWSRDPMLQVRQGLNPTVVQGPPVSFSRPDLFGPKIIGSGLRPLAPNESCGPSVFPSMNSGFGNGSALSDRGPLSGIMTGGPSHLIAQKNPLAPGMNRLLDFPRGDPMADRLMRGLPDQGTMHQPFAPGGYRSDGPVNFNTGPKLLPANNSDGRIGSFGYSQFMPPSSQLNADRLPFGPSSMTVMPTVPEMPEKKASPLTAEILNRIRGKDVQSATFILNSLVASNPALQKVNIGSLLNLLVKTGTIK